jgi:hypothetical protein
VRVRFRHEAPEGLYTVRERVHGPTLDELVTLALEREKNFPEPFILYVGAKLASALAHVHACVDEHGQLWALSSATSTRPPLCSPGAAG